MSLQYIIDGCNVINNPLFIRRRKSNKDPRLELSGFIRLNGLCGSLKNTTEIVFDGFPPAGEAALRSKETIIIFSGDDSADNVIRRLLEKSASPKNIRVVSDDKEVRLFARFSGACAVSVEEFISKGESLKPGKNTYRPSLETKEELNGFEVQKINQELERRWLK